MLENSERSVRGVRMGKSGLLEHAELANQIQGFRIPVRWDASEKNNYRQLLLLPFTLAKLLELKKQRKRLLDDYTNLLKTSITD